MKRSSFKCSNTHYILIPLRIDGIRHRKIEVAHLQRYIFAIAEQWCIVHMPHVCVMVQLHDFMHSRLCYTGQRRLYAKLFDNELDNLAVHYIGLVGIDVTHCLAQATGHQD